MNTIYHFILLRSISFKDYIVWNAKPHELYNPETPL